MVAAVFGSQHFYNTFCWLILLEPLRKLARYLTLNSGICQYTV